MGMSFQAIAEAAVRAASEDISKKTQPKWIEVQNAAKKFYYAYNAYKKNANFLTNVDMEAVFNKIIEPQIQNITQGKTKNLSKEIQASRKQLQLIKKQLANKNNALELRTVYLLAFNFQELYKKYIQILPSEVRYVTNTGEVYTTSLQWLALTATAGGRVSNFLGKDTVYTQKMDNIDEKTYDEYIKLLNSIDQFFQNIEIAFANKSAQEKIESGYFFKKKGVDDPLPLHQKALIKTREDLYSFILNKGDLKEGYVKSLVLGGSILSNIADINNLSSFLYEDITTDFSNIAVKSEGAALPKLQPFYNAAIAIINSKNEISKQQMQTILKDTPSVRNIIEKTAADVLEKTGAQDIFAQFGINIKDLIPQT